jgi:hypothetical protein
MNDKKPVPTAVLYKNNGDFPPIDFNWMHIMHICREALSTDHQYVILPVEEHQDYKPQRRLIIKGDKASPRGLIQRDRYARERYYPYASARFDAEELVKYAADQFNKLPPAEIERMVAEALDAVRNDGC